MEKVNEFIEYADSLSGKLNNFLMFDLCIDDRHYCEWPDYLSASGHSQYYAL